MFYRLQNEPFRDITEKFEANCEYNLVKKQYAKLEQQDLGVSKNMS